jgi:hypothetical protein
MKWLVDYGQSVRTASSVGKCRAERVCWLRASSYRLVAPMTTTFLLSPPKPSMHASIWFSVCSTYGG